MKKHKLPDLAGKRTGLPQVKEVQPLVRLVQIVVRFGKEGPVFRTSVDPANIKRYSPRDSILPSQGLLDASNCRA